MARDGSPRRQLLAVGLVAVVLHVTVVATALTGLRDVGAAHAEVARIVTAQRYFQDADMAHDRMRAHALLLLVQADAGAGWSRTNAVRAGVLEEDVRGFRADLQRVDELPLTSDLTAAVQDVRPLQEVYASDAQRLSELVRTDLPAARRLFGVLEAAFQDLVVQQHLVTNAMSEEAARRRDAALDDERGVLWRLTASAAVVLLALLGLTSLLHRLGSRLSALVARERGVAETLQHSLLPDRLPELPGVRFAARYRAGGMGAQVGGDWYDVMALPGGKVGLVMGDVVGHDLQAAASMGQLRNALRACAAEGAPPNEVLQRLNRLCNTQDLGEMATVLYAVLDPVAGTLCATSAGHYPPLLVDGSERRFLQLPAGPPIGAVREPHYSSSTCALPPGSLLLLFTDGLVERRTASVDEGLACLQQVVAPMDDDLERLCDDVLAGMGVGDADDDVALLVVALQAELGQHVDVVWPAKAERLTVMRHLLTRWLTEAGADEDEVYDIVVAVSEAATNAVEHAYGPGSADFRMAFDVQADQVTIVVRDWGQWRHARGQDRGRGLSLMEGLMDTVQISHGDQGTEVRMSRRLQPREPRVPASTSEHDLVGAP